MEAKVYTTAGKENGTVTLPEEVFGLSWNGDLVHQVVVSMQSNARTSVAHTKDRSDVRGGGKKPWRQKGTGRARHGSTRSPIWVGGGVTFGPRNERNFKKKINKKMRTKALYTVLSEKLRNNEIIFVDDLAVAEGKTKTAKEILSTLGSVKGYEDLSTKKKSAAYIAMPQKSDEVARGFSNFGNLTVRTVSDMNPSALLNYKYVIIAKPDESVKALSGRMNRSSEE